MKLVFKERVDRSGDVASFVFAPAEPLVWEAGQSIKIEIPGPYGPLEHRFTISSAPFEKHIMITTRLSGSPYKNSLAALKQGDEVDAFSVEGDFVWRQSDKPHILVAAGIGITPYRSMLLQRAHQQKPIAAQLIYGSSTDPIYNDELDRLAAEHSEFTVSYVGGRLGANDIPQTQSLIYLSGPSAMVDELVGALILRGVNKKQLVRDWFTGRLAV
jgi:ferredoxin-NADP reductase